MKNQTLIALVLFLGALGVYLGLVQPLYSSVQALKPRSAQLDAALKNADQFRARMKELSAEFLVKTDNENARRLQKLLPDNIDNVRLIIDINNIARGREVAIRDFSITENAPPESPTRGAARRAARSEELSPSGPRYRSVDLSFTAEAPYRRFLAFLDDLQNSLRLVDVRKIQVSPAVPVEGEEAEEPNYQFSLTLTTYWLE